jgi:hypothetical protein
VETTRKTLKQFREAIQNNRIAFPQPAPKFACQSRPEIQWRAAELFLVHNWTCSRLGARYGVTRGRIWWYVRSWIDRAQTLGYLQDIPPAESLAAAISHTAVAKGAMVPLPSQWPPAPSVANNPLHIS